MCPVLTVAGTDEEQIPENKNVRTTPVVREDPQLVDHIITPDDICILWSRLNSRFIRSSDVLSLIFKGSDVPFRQAVRGETEYLAACCHDVNSIPLDCGR